MNGEARADERLILRADVDLRFGLGNLSLAEQAGEESRGDSELSPGILGPVIGIGLDTGDVTIGAEAAIYVGGLALAEVEERYFGGPSNVGSSLTVSAGLATAYQRPLWQRWDWIARLGAGFSRMSASSGAGNARVDTLYMDVGAGVVYPISIGALDAQVTIVAASRIHRLRRFSVSGLTDGSMAADSPAVFYHPGLTGGFTALF